MKYIVAKTCKVGVSFWTGSKFSWEYPDAETYKGQLVAIKEAVKAARYAFANLDDLKAIVVVLKHYGYEDAEIIKSIPLSDLAPRSNPRRNPGRTKMHHVEGSIEYEPIAGGESIEIEYQAELSDDPRSAPDKIDIYTPTDVDEETWDAIWADEWEDIEAQCLEDADARLANE
jgi:hypothetical protein